MAAATNETLWISFFKGQQLKFEGSFSSHLFFFWGGGGVSHKKWNNQESVRSDVDECIKCTANNYATLSSCKSYLGEQTWKWHGGGGWGGGFRKLTSNIRNCTVEIRVLSILNIHFKDEASLLIQKRKSARYENSFCSL